MDTNDIHAELDRLRIRCWMAEAALVPFAALAAANTDLPDTHALRPIKVPLPDQPQPRSPTMADCRRALRIVEVARKEGKPLPGRTRKPI